MLMVPRAPDGISRSVWEGGANPKTLKGCICLSFSLDLSLSISLGLPLPLRRARVVSRGPGNEDTLSGAKTWQDD